MTSIEPFDIIVQFDPRATVHGADGLCYKRKNTQATNIDPSDNGMNICGNSNGQEKLQKNYSKLINYLSRTDDIAAKLFEEGNIPSCQLEMIQNETNKIRKNELFLNAIQRSGGHVFDRLINALQETQQSCILRLLQEGIDFSLDHVQLIQRNYMFLVDNVELMSGLLDKMFQCESFTNREIEEIKSKDGSHKKNQELLSLLLRKSPASFQRFIEALATTNQKHIAEKFNFVDDMKRNVQTTGDNSSNSNHHTNEKSLHDPSKKGQSVRQVLDITKFCTLPVEIQMCVSLKMINKVFNSDKRFHLFVRQTIETLHEELKRGIHTSQSFQTLNEKLNQRIEKFLKNEQNLKSELNGEKQRNKQLIETIFEGNENVRKIEEEKHLIKQDRDLNRNEKQQLNEELQIMEKELEKNRRAMDKFENSRKLEIEQLMRVLSESEQEIQKIRQIRDSIANENCKIYAELEEVRNQLEILRHDDVEMKLSISLIKKEKEMIVDDQDKIKRENSQLLVELTESRNHLVQCELNIVQLNEQLLSVAQEKLRVVEKQHLLLNENRRLSIEVESLKNDLDIHRIDEKNRDEAAKQKVGQSFPKQANNQLSREISEIEQEKKEMEGNIDSIEIKENRLNTESDELTRNGNVLNLKAGKKPDLHSENVYCEAHPVDPVKLPQGEKSPKLPERDKKTPYKETDSDDDDEECSYYHILQLKRSLHLSRSSWFTKANSLQAKQKLEQKAQRLSKSSYALTGKGFASTVQPVLAEQNADPDELPLMNQPSAADEELESDGFASMMMPQTDLDQMRKSVWSSILESEQSYIEILDILMQHMQIFKSLAGSAHAIISVKDIETIFHQIPELHEVHYKFVKSLEPKILNWSAEQEVGIIYKHLAFDEYSIARDYLKNYQEAVTTIQRCRTESTKFAELTKSIKSSYNDSCLEDLLLKPILRFQQNSLVLHDLVSSTLTSHNDYDPLQRALCLAKDFIDDCAGLVGNKITDDVRYLVKHGLVVEKLDNERKLRHIFLFNDLLVCVKQKINGRFHVCWYLLLSELQVEDIFSAQEENQGAIQHQQKIDSLQKELIKLQTEYSVELKKLQLSEKQLIPKSRKLDGIRKRLMEQEALLLISSPHLKLKIHAVKPERSHTFLLASDYERSNWRDTISGLVGKAKVPPKLLLSDIVSLVNAHKASRPVANISENNDLFIEDRIDGNLNITIHKLQGLKEVADTFCSIEVDSLGHFFMKAKTNTIKNIEPKWNEDFDIDLNGALTLHILCYKIGQKSDSLLGKSALMLNKAWLLEKFEEQAISMSDGMMLTISLKYTTVEDTKKQTLFSPKGRLFGLPLEIVTAKEGKPIPILVTSCINELERRGLKDLGIYQVSGLAAEIQRLRTCFDKNSSEAAGMVKEAKTNVLTGILIIFFWELPDSLFTGARYPLFKKGLEIREPKVKEKFLVSQLCSLPECNYATATCLMEHLVRVSRLEDINKMSLHNLATIFGPKLMRPAMSNDKPTAMEQLLCNGTNEVIMQSSVLLFFLNLKASNFVFPR